MNLNSSLPDVYEFVYDDEIQPEEVFAVRISTGWEQEEKPASKDGWLSYPESALIAVGVRHVETKELVGMGFVVGNKRHAVLCDFNVRPEHQHKGIGRAILDERIRLAEELKIPFLYTELGATNPLAELYKSLGFESSSNIYVSKSL